LLLTQLINRLTIAVVEQTVSDVGGNTREAAGGSGSIWIECHRSFPICPGRMRTCDFVLVTLEYSRCVGDHKSQNNFGERCQQKAKTAARGEQRSFQNPTGMSAGVVVQLKCTSARVFL
jgi:hypothetical protein